MLQTITQSDMLRAAFLRPQLRTSRLQSLWSTLHRLSLWGMNIGPAGKLSESGEDWVLAQAMQTNPAASPFVLFDVGANAGHYAQGALAHSNPALKLYCFEPSTPTFQRLSANLAGAGQAKLFQFGFSDAESESILHYHTGGEAEASLYHRDLSHWGIDQCETTSVRLQRLDTFCGQQGVGQIDFLKIDVEGHEVAVLEGAGAM